MSGDTAAIQVVFGSAFFAVLGAGIHILRHFGRFFGVDPEMPSENASSRSYSKLQFIVIWLHALFLTAAFTLLLH